MSSPARMQIRTRDPSVMENSLPDPPHIVLTRHYCPTPQMGYGLHQQSSDQQSSRISKEYPFFQPTLCSADLQLTWTPQMWSSGPQNQLPHKSPASDRNHRSNITHHASSKAGQVETLTVNLNYDPKVLYTANPMNNKDLHFIQNGSCTSNEIKNSSRTYGSVPPRLHPINQHHGLHAAHQPGAESRKAFLTAQINHKALTTNMNQGQMIIVRHHSETPNSAAHVPAAGLPVNALLPSEFMMSSSQMSQSRVHNPSYQPTPCINYDGYGNIDLQRGSVNIPHLPKRARLNSTTVSGLTANSNSTFSTSASHTSSPWSRSGSTNCSHGHLVHQLMPNYNKISGLHSSTFGSQLGKSISGANQSTPDRTTRCQDKAGQGKKYQDPVKETRWNSVGAVNHLAEQLRSRLEMSNWKKRNEECCIDPGENQKLVKSQRRIVRISKAVAVVSPISQQVFSHGPQNDGTTSTHLSLLLKTNIVKNPFEKHENIEKETNVQNVTFNLIKGLPQAPLLPSSSPSLGSAVDISEMPTTGKYRTSGSQGWENSQCEHDPVSTNNTKDKCQDSAHVVDSISNVSVKQSNIQEFQSSSEETKFDLSTVPVVEYTLQDLKDLVESLEVKAAEKHGGDKQNLAALKGVFKTSSELCAKEKHAVVLQYPLSKHVKMLENCSQILGNETTLSSEHFKSSWLNVNGQPADVDNVLAEPISDYNLTGCKKVSQPLSESVGEGVNSLALTGTDHSKDLCVNAHQDIPKTITDMVTDDQRSFTDPSLASRSDECETNNKEVFEKADDSDDSDSTNDLPEIILFSPEEARKLYSECFEHDQKREPRLKCQEESKGFTCPHMNNLSSDSEFFCPSCWNKTPIFYIDQDESLLTLK